MTWRDTVGRLADRSEVTVLELFTAYRNGTVTRAEFVSVLARTIGTYNARAVALADLGLAASLTAQLRQPVAAIGLPAPDDLGRLTDAARTLLAALDDTLDPTARLTRFARSEPLSRAQRAYGDAMSQSPHVTGWRRGLSPAACQLCRWWARDGAVFRADHPMPHHKGCTCTPIPVTSGGDQ